MNPKINIDRPTNITKNEGSYADIVLNSETTTGILEFNGEDEIHALPNVHQSCCSSSTTEPPYSSQHHFVRAECLCASR